MMRIHKREVVGVVSVMEPDWAPLPLAVLEQLFDEESDDDSWLDDSRLLHPRVDPSPGGAVASAVPVRWAIPGVYPDELEGVAASAGSGAGAEPSAAMLALVAAVEAYCVQDPVLLEAGRALADAQVLARLQDRLRVKGMTVMADVSARSLHELAGARSAAAWHRQVAPDADPTDLGFGTKVRPHRHLHGAVEAGLVSIKAGKKVLRALRQCGHWVDRPDGLIDGQPAQPVMDAVISNVVTLIAQSRMGLADDDPLLNELLDATARIVTSGTGELDRLEQAFTLLAQHVPLGMLSAMLEELFLAIVPSELERRAEAAHDRRDLTVTELPDRAGFDIRIRTDIPLGEKLFTALRSELRRDPANPLDTAAADALRQQGIDPFDPHVPGVFGADSLGADSLGPPRSRGRRMHDALDRLLTRYLEHGMGGMHHKVPVQINVTLTDQSLTAQPGALPAKGDSGQPIPRSLLRRWWTDSRVTAFVLSLGGQALRSTHLGRTLTARERQALLIQQGHRCAGVGCCRGSTRAGPDPTTDLRPHHVHGYALIGTTSLGDSIMICDTGHHDLHEGHKTIRLRDGRLLNEKGWATEADLTPPEPPF
jgi:hypothetical protein